MERLFTGAAAFAVVLMVATAALGLWLGDLHGVTDRATLVWGTVHRLTGVASALVVVLVNSVAVTYFIGTGRWCREVVEAYGLAGSLVARAATLKRAAFPFALGGMLAVVAIVALGGAADPAAGRRGSSGWVTWHLLGGLLLPAAIAACFLAQRPAIRRQHELIDEVMDEVRRARAARGLDTSDGTSMRQG